MLRRRFVVVHRWLGLVVGLHLLLLGLTGVLMALGEPWERVSGHRTSGTGKVTLAQVMEAVRVKTGATQDPGWVKAPPEGSGLDWRMLIDLAPQGGKRQRAYVHVDSGTGEVTKVVPYEASVKGASFSFHHELFLSGKVGRPIVAVSGMLSLLLSILGVVIWWRAGRGPTLALRMKGLRAPSLQARLLALHELIAVWTVVGLVGSTLSGIVLAKPDWFGGSLGKPPPTSARVDFARLTDALAGQPFEQVRFAPDADTVAITLIRGGQFTVDPQTFVITPRPAPPSTFVSVMRTLHEGHYWGPVGTVVITLVGLVPLVLFVSALLSWWLGRKAQSPQVAE